VTDVDHQYGTHLGFVLSTRQQIILGDEVFHSIIDLGITQTLGQEIRSRPSQNGTPEFSRMLIPTPGMLFCGFRFQSVSSSENLV
jgi:hypothetical protein